MSENKVTTAIPTREQVEDLKAQWCADPCWDIGDTDGTGFEAYHYELKAYQAHMERVWRDRWEAKLNDLADKLGCPGNRKLAEYVMRLEQRIEKLEAVRM